MEYKRLIIEMLEKIKEDNDIIFLKQIYTLIKRHIEKDGGCISDQSIE